MQQQNNGNKIPYSNVCRTCPLGNYNFFKWFDPIKRIDIEAFITDQNVPKRKHR